jgi:glycine dehydrogenase
LRRTRNVLRHGDGDVGDKRDEIVARALEKINLRIGDTTLGIALDETTTPRRRRGVWRAFGGKLAMPTSKPARAIRCPAELKRAPAPS